ncbi:hypothetical protein [Novosphingobium naphthalenivorans]|uniref:hypothetical protein n=1 Tax=Novosphingobium naphthalenivorans TaxID=273168 RepID=UPI00082EFC6D|nr:hypothetical protein [Novosphingobium naphthalenivorans]
MLHNGLKSIAARLGLGTALAATVLTLTAPAQARDHYRGHGGDDAAIAIGAGIIGLAIGAAIADSHDDRYYDSGYYPARRYVTVRGYPGYYYYYDGYPNRYYRDRYYSRYYAPYYRDRWSRGRDWRYDGRDYSRDYYRDGRRDRHEYREGYRDGRHDGRHDGYRDRDDRGGEHRDWRRR